MIYMSRAVAVMAIESLKECLDGANTILPEVKRAQRALAEMEKALAAADIAPVTPLEKAARQWYAHENIMRSNILPDTLRISMCLNHQGMFVERECVIDNGEWALGVLGARVVAAKTARYAQDMVDAITAAKRSTNGNGR